MHSRIYFQIILRFRLTSVTGYRNVHIVDNLNYGAMGEAHENFEMIHEYRVHLKKGTIRAIASKLPMPKTTGLGDTDCNQRGYEQNVVTDINLVNCSKCLNKFATFEETRRKAAERHSIEQAEREAYWKAKETMEAN